MPRILSTLLIGLSALPCLAQRHLEACVSDAKLPPFAFWQTPAGVMVDGINGVTIEVLNRISERLGLDKPKVQALPLRRCLKMVENGQLDLVLNVPTAQIDPAPFLITDSYATLHSNYFYSRKYFGKGLVIKDLSDLPQYRICGIAGFSYEAYGLKPRQVDDGARDYPALINKLKANRCDLFIEKREVMASLSNMDGGMRAMLADPQIVSTALPDETVLGLHMAISRRIADAAKLQQQINAQIKRLNQGKVVDRLLEPYLK